MHNVDMLDDRKIHVWGATEQEGARFHYVTQNSMQYRTYEMIISEISHLVISDRSLLWS